MMKKPKEKQFSLTEEEIERLRDFPWGRDKRRRYR